MDRQHARRPATAPKSLQPPGCQEGPATWRASTSGRSVPSQLGVSQWHAAMAGSRSARPAPARMDERRRRGIDTMHGMPHVNHWPRRASGCLDMIRRRLALLALVAVVTPAAVTLHAAAYTPRVPAGTLGINGQFLLNTTDGAPLSSQQVAQLDQVQSLGIGVIRLDAAWQGVEPNRPDPVTGAHTYIWTRLDTAVTEMAQTASAGRRSSTTRPRGPPPRGTSSRRPSTTPTGRPTPAPWRAATARAATSGAPTRRSRRCRCKIGRAH